MVWPSNLNIPPCEKGLPPSTHASFIKNFTGKLSVPSTIKSYPLMISLMFTDVSSSWYVITKDFPDYIGQINREVFATWAGDGNYYNSQLNRELNYIVSYEEGTYSFLSVKIKFKDILYWSPNKQELEPFIAANKFGI